MPRECRAPDDPRTKLYNSAAWQRTRKTRLDMDGHVCRSCGAPARSVHHAPLSVLDLIAQGIDPLDVSTCLTLCARCHGRADGAQAPRPPSEQRAPEKHPGLR